MEGSIHITGDGNAVGTNNTTNVTKTTMTSGATLPEFTTLLGQLRESLHESKLDPKVARVAEADLAIVEGEVEEDEPSGSIIAAKLKSIADMAKNAASIGTAGSTFLPQLQQAIEMVKHLFK
jgi:hypothetical protein